MSVTGAEIAEGFIGAAMQVLLFWYMYRAVKQGFPKFLPLAIAVFWFTMWMVRKAGVRMYKESQAYRASQRDKNQSVG